MPPKMNVQVEMMDAFSVAVFVFIVGGIWLYAYKRSRSVDNNSGEGFFLGGRSLTGLTIAGTIIMTNLSTEQIVGQNGQSFAGGMQVMAWEVTSAFACVVLALVFLPKYFKYGVDTVSDFVEIRYDTTTKRIVSLLFIVTYMTSFLPVVLYSGALVFNKIFHIDTAFGLDPLVAIALIAAFIGIIGLAYLMLGGAFTQCVQRYSLWNRFICGRHRDSRPRPVRAWSWKSDGRFVHCEGTVTGDAERHWGG